MLEWDTNYFGINSAKVSLKGVVDESGQKEILNFCDNFDFITISNFGNVRENNYWIGNKTNAFLTDINIQFLKVLTNRIKYKDADTYIDNYLVRNDQILSIAKTSFTYSRFFNDPMLPREKVERIYHHWTECAFDQENKFFAISEREGNIAGYLLFSITEDTSVIELIAVDKKYQRQNVGRSLMLSMESFVMHRGITKVKVGTQINNISAAQFYSLMGFKYVNCGSIYHLW